MKSLVYCDLLIKNKEILKRYAETVEESKIKILQIKKSAIDALDIKYSVSDNIGKSGLFAVSLTLILLVLYIIFMDMKLIYRNVRSFFDIIHRPFIVNDIKRSRTYSFTDDDYTPTHVYIK
jgi:predicted PurR-regulated permease PerM